MSSTTQFSLRSVLLALTATAVLCAAASPWVRTWETARQLQLGLALVSFLAGTTLPILAYAIWRKRASTKAGPILLELTHSAAVANYIAVGAALLLGPITMAVIASFSLLFFEPLLASGTSVEISKFHHVLYYAVILFAGVQLGIGLCQGSHFTRGSIRFCENGIVHTGVLFAPWSQVTLRDWNIASGSLKLVLKRNYTDLEVLPDQRADVDEVVAQFLSSNPNALLRNPGDPSSE